LGVQALNVGRSVSMALEHRDISHPDPERDLHHAENADRHQIREGVIRMLRARIDRDLLEFE
jgi:hypothetical protein